MGIALRVWVVMIFSVYAGYFQPLYSYEILCYASLQQRAAEYRHCIRRAADLLLSTV
jgi:hypothetical protein